jgi:hypothetical protein
LSLGEGLPALDAGSRGDEQRLSNALHRLVEEDLCLHQVLSRPNRGLEYAERALALEPNGVEAVLQKAEAMAMQGKEAAAFQLLDQAVESKAHWRFFLTDVANPGRLTAQFAHLYNELLRSLGRTDRASLHDTFPGVSKKLGRNDPCPCGSGKKYKKCCLAKHGSCLSQMTRNPTDRTYPDAPAERLQGAVEHVTFHSEESGFCILRVKLRGQHDLVTVVGTAAVDTAGEYVECEGDWNNDRHHRLQFKAHRLRVVPPSTLECIEKYLGSGMVKGTGPHFARKLVHAFGQTGFDVIEQSPERLLELEVIDPKRKERVTRAWAEQKVIREIMVFFSVPRSGYGQGGANL